MSAKTSAQPGRRTPLSLSGATSKQSQQQQQQTTLKNQNKTNSSNQKTEQTNVQEIKETVQKDNKKQQNVEKKSQQQNTKVPPATPALGPSIKKPERNDDKKTQNGVGNSSNGNNTAKDKQQNGKETTITDSASVKEKKDKIEKTEQTEKPLAIVEKKEKQEKEKDKEQVNEKEKPKDEEKEQSKVIEDKPEKESRPKRGNEDSAEKQKQQLKQEDEKIVIGTSDEKQRAPATPTTKSKAPKAATPNKKVEVSTSATPTKHASDVKATTAPIRTKVITTAIDDVEMEPLTFKESSPDILTPVDNVVPLSTAAIFPAATSTPGKIFNRKDINSEPRSVVKIASGSPPNRNSCPRTLTQISGRRSIRPSNDYTPSHFQNSDPYRESYRRINTELDVTSTTNTSLNVTVGSEVPNNFSFSFFGRGRKRDRTPPPYMSQSTMELQGDLEISPKSPKRARIDIQGFFSAVASPLTMLRSRFAKTTIQSSTPVKLHAKSTVDEYEDGEVQNVSGVSIEEEIHNGAGGHDDLTSTEEVTVGNIAGEEAPMKDAAVCESADMVVDADSAIVVKPDVNLEKDAAEKPTEGIEEEEENSDDIKITETLNKDGGVGIDPLAKNKRCRIM